MYFKITLFVLCLVLGKTVGNLRCYACTFSSTDTDQSCLTISDDTRTVACSARYCTIMRQEYIDPAGAVASFIRGCDDEPDFLNHDITDPTFRTYYRACTTDLCNVGNGIQSVAGGVLSPRPVYDGENLLVPGTGTSGAKALIASAILTALLLVAVM